MLLLIGSHATQFWFPDARKPLDTDYIGTYEDAQAYFTANPPIKLVPVSDIKLIGHYPDRYPVEIELAWDGTLAKELLDYAKTRGLPRWLGEYTGAMVADPGMLLALKLSHRYKKNSPHFLKTMRDIQFLRSKGAEIPADLQDWFKRREKETYNYKHPNLNQSKKDFFAGDGVKYVYDHDSIHVAVAHGPTPAYTKYLKDGSPVAVDKAKFFALSELEKLQSVAEESYVLALERSQIPFPGVKTPRESFEYALFKVCTSITSGWWREYAWEHYDEVLAIYNDYYVENFWNREACGLVKPFAA